MANVADFTPQDLEDWFADQRNLADTGEYFFSLNRYLFSARRPR